MRHSSTTDDQHDANWPAVLSMAITMFALVCSELLPISILTPMAKDLELSVGEAGQAVTATAVVAAVASPAVIVLAGRIDRRLLIRGLTVVLLLSSLLASVATDQWTLLFARGLLGVALGGTWAMVTTLALRLVSPAQVARAMSIIFTGVTAASVAAPAAGAFLGETWGWRGVFLVTAGLGVLALLAQLSTLPRLPTMHRPALNAFGDALSRAPVLGGLVTIVLVLSGQFAGYTFIRPLLEQVVTR